MQDLFVERAQDIPLCIVTPDFSNNEAYRIPPLEDDPFESIGFITTFSTWSMELAPLFTTTTSSFCGYLAELERVLLEPVASSAAPSAINASTGAATSSNSSMVDKLRAYFQILEVSSLLGLDRDISDHAVQLFRDCSSTAHMRNRNVEALATAALVQASREAKEARTLQEISTAANVSQKEIHRYLKILTDALQLSQPIDSNSISVYMPRFCSILELEKSTQDLATHIGEVVMNKSFCTRRNPISISAAAIYLSCQLEDKRKTQTEICKATALTEVTLRKVYKELLENINDLLPAHYTPAVPIEKAFPVPVSILSRVPATRGIAPGGLGSSTQPLQVFKPNLGTMSLSKVHLSSNEISSGAATSSSLAASEDITTERSDLLGSSNSMPKSCLERSVTPNNDASILAALSSSLGATDASSVGKSASPEKACIDWERNVEDLTKVKLSTPKRENVHQQFNFFERCLPDAFPSASGSCGPQVMPFAASSLPMKDGPATVSLPFLGLADEELVKDSVHGRLTRYKGNGQEEAGSDNKADASSPLVFQEDPGYASGCSIKALGSTTSTRSTVSQGVPKCLWDLNLAESTPHEDILSQNLPAHCEGLGQESPQVKEGVSDRGDEFNTIPDNFSFFNTTAAPAANFNAMQQSMKRPSFWQRPPYVKFSLADSISFSGEDNSIVTDLPVKAAGLVDNDGELPPVTYLSGKAARSPSIPTANLLTKLSREINSDKNSALDEAIFHRSCDKNHKRL